MIPTTGEKSICEMCGETFECGAKTGNCPCFQINLPPETLAELRENFANCLCLSCIIAFDKRNSRSDAEIVRS